MNDGFRHDDGYAQGHGLPPSQPPFAGYPGGPQQGNREYAFPDAPPQNPYQGQRPHPGPAFPGDPAALGAGPVAPGPAGGKGSGKTLVVSTLALVGLLVAGVAAYVVVGRDGDVGLSGTQQQTTESPIAPPTSDAPTPQDSSPGAPGSTARSSAAPSSAPRSSGSSSSPRTSSPAPTGSAGRGDGSLSSTYAASLPKSFVDQLRNCSEVNVTITRHAQDTTKRQAPGMRCSGVKGSGLDGKNVEFVHEDQWSRSAIDNAKSMEHQVLTESGGKFVAVTSYTSGSSKIYFSDTTAGVAMEVYPFTTKDAALEVARPLAG